MACKPECSPACHWIFYWYPIPQYYTCAVKLSGYVALFIIIMWQSSLNAEPNCFFSCISWVDKVDEALSVQILTCACDDGQICTFPGAGWHWEEANNWYTGICMHVSVSCCLSNSQSCNYKWTDSARPSDSEHTKCPMFNHT